VLSDDDLRRLEAVGTEADIPAGQVLIERGQSGTGLFVIRDGTVVVEAPEGPLEFGPGSLLGERALLASHGIRAARVRASTELRVLAVSRREFDRICADEPEFADRLRAAGG
jgi:CRP-like cAMP-binding protein